MAFTDDLDNDMTDCFLNTSEFGETVTLTFDDETTRSVVAVVWEQRGAIDNKEQALIVIHDNATTGALGSEIDGGMTITRSNGEVWQIIDIQTDFKAHSLRCVLPLERS